MNQNMLHKYKMPVILWAAITLFFIFQFILRLSVGILQDEILVKYNINADDFGSLAGYYYLGYAAMQIPFGMMLDRYNFRYVTVVAIMVTMLGTLIFAFTENWEIVLLGRLLIGAGSAASFLAVAKTIKLFFKEEYHAMMIGFSFTFGLLGAVFGGKPMKIIFNHLGYNQVFYILCIICIVIALIILIVSDKKIERIEDQASGDVNFAGILKVFLNPVILLIGISGGLMVGALEGFTDVWAMPFFKQIYGFAREDSIFAASVVFIGMCFGGPILAFCANIINSLVIVIFATGILTSFIFFLLLHFITWDYYVLCGVMFALGILCCYQVLVFSLVSKLVSPQHTGIGIAIINCLNMSAGWIFHRIIGKSLQNNWDGEFANSGAPLYSLEAFQRALISIPIGSILGVIGFLIVGYIIWSRSRV